jgi:hypothetical protein
MQKTHAFIYDDFIVDKESAIALANKPVTPIDADHVGLVQPNDSDADSYQAVKGAFEETFGTPPEDFSRKPTWSWVDASDAQALIKYCGPAAPYVRGDQRSGRQTLARQAVETLRKKKNIQVQPWITWFLRPARL